MRRLRSFLLGFLAGLVLLGAALALAQQLPVPLLEGVDRQHPLARGLVAWYPVLPHLAGGLRWYDVVGQAHGTLGTTGSVRPTWGADSTGRFAGAVRLTGANGQFVALADTPFDFERTQPFSVSVWFTSAVVGGGATVDLVSKYQASGTFTGWGLCLFSTNEAFFFLSNAAGDFIQNTATGLDVDDGRWHHLVATYSGSSTAAGIVLYVDGRLTSMTASGTGTLTGSVLNNHVVTLGANAVDNAQYLTGSLTNVALDNRVLSAAEVAALSRQVAPDYGGLMQSLDALALQEIPPGVRRRSQIQ